jgi:hypothetical protein
MLNVILYRSLSLLLPLLLLGLFLVLALWFLLLWVLPLSPPLPIASSSQQTLDSAQLRASYVPLPAPVRH